MPDEEYDDEDDSSSDGDGGGNGSETSSSLSSVNDSNVNQSSAFTNRMAQAAVLRYRPGALPVADDIISDSS